MCVCGDQEVWDCFTGQEWMDCWCGLQVVSLPFSQMESISHCFYLKIQGWHTVLFIWSLKVCSCVRATGCLFAYRRASAMSVFAFIKTMSWTMQRFPGCCGRSHMKACGSYSGSSSMLLPSAPSVYMYDSGRCVSKLVV